MTLSLKLLIAFTILLSLIVGFFPSLTPWLALSGVGLKHLFLWQPLTYVLIERGPISFNFFLNLAFNMYILWVFGMQLMERSHEKLFFLLYFGAALVGGLAAVALPHALLAGPTNAVYAILVAWMLLNQRARLLLFFSIPFNALWLILGVVALTMAIDLSSGYWARALSLAVACIYAYFFALLAWRTPGPFPHFRKFEKRLFQFLERRKKQASHSASKIYDIKSGEPVMDDAAFMDAMLDRISRHGEGSLTSAEKKRMKSISKRQKGL
ncbi:MAG: rhomboid family intramembrane serine protease [Verrucomicrobia bacterium]|nr:rhomboid family intramembrane serine protease [Verrucomicrobiota bacterium]MBU6445815.1 rhomboid family intramembrane serine protease [Verrucomicrobiota bacterium]